MTIIKAKEILNKKGINPKAVVKFMKVKLDKKTMLDCIVAYDDKHFYILHDRVIFANMDVIIERKDESISIQYFDDLARKIIAYSIKLTIYTQKRILVVEDPIDGDIKEFFEGFYLRGVETEHLIKTRYMLKKMIKYGKIAASLASGGIVAYLAEEMAEEKFKEFVSEAVVDNSDKIADAIVDSTSKKLFG